MSPHLEKRLNDLDNNISEIMRHAEKKCSKLHSTVQNDRSVKFHQKLQNMHRARNKRNKCRVILPGQPIAEAAIEYRNAIREYELARQEYIDIKSNDANERTAHIKK